MKWQPAGVADWVRRNQPAFALLGLVSVALGLRWAVQTGVPLPFCLLRKLIGVPCPACGCTRSLLAWADLDLSSAFLFNPLFFIASVGIAMWACAWLAGKLSGGTQLQRIELFLQRASVVRVIALLAFINWLYLCLKLPK